MRNLLVTFLGLFYFLNSNALIGGAPVLPNDSLARSVVGIYLEHTGDPQGKYCTGTLIKPRVVITAAHCLTHENNLKIEVGFLSEPMKAIESGNREYVRSSHRGLIYPGFLKAKDEWERKRNDVALIYLDENAPAWAIPLQVVSPYSLPVFSDKVLTAASGSEQEGSTERYTPLKKAEFYVLKDVETYFAAMHLLTQPNDPTVIMLKNGTNTGNVLFLTQVNSEASPTHGDSGAPAIINRYGVTTVVGVLSGSLYLENKVFGTFYLNLHEPSINRWIRTNY